MDFVTDLLLSQGFNAFMTAVEKLTKYVVVMPYVLREGQLSAAATANLFFDGIVSRFGVPKAIVLDRDPRFTAALWS